MRLCMNGDQHTRARRLILVYTGVYLVYWKGHFHSVRQNDKWSLIYIWIAPCENVSSDIWGQRRPDQPAHRRILTRAFPVHLTNHWIQQKVWMESKGPDDTLRMRKMIWICAFCAPSRHTTLKWRRINVDATWSRRIDVDTTSFWCCVPTGHVRRHFFAWRGPYKRQHLVSRHLLNV